jgi:hypothetical protein
MDRVDGQRYLRVSAFGSSEEEPCYVARLRGDTGEVTDGVATSSECLHAHRDIQV